MQALEGGIDPGHAAFLHSKRSGANRRGPFLINRLMAQDIEAHVHVLQEDYGVLIATRREHEEGEFWRTNVFLMPFYTMAGRFGDTPIVRWSGWIPMDDENTMRWQVECDTVQPILQNDSWVQERVAQGRPPLGQDLDDTLAEDLEPPSHRIGSPFRTLPNQENDYFMDRSVQKEWNYSGMSNGNVEDQAVTESMGVIYARHREHLGTTDLGIIATRQVLLRAAKAIRDTGATPRGVDNPGAYRVNASNMVLPTGGDWVVRVREATKAEPGVYTRMASL